MAKEFSDVINERTRRDRIKANLTQATGGRGTQSEAEAAEKEARARDGRTQGRKGCKAARINMAFSPENHAFIQFVARYKGMSLTQFVNDVLDQYREEHADAYQKVQELSKEL